MEQSEKGLGLMVAVARGSTSEECEASAVAVGWSSAVAVDWSSAHVEVIDGVLGYVVAEFTCSAVVEQGWSSALAEVSGSMAE